MLPTSSKVAPLALVIAAVLCVLMAAASLPAQQQSQQSPTVAEASGTEAAAPTFYGEVQPIVQARCQSCHRPGEVAPMSLLTYGDVRRWAPNIKRVVQERVMPPWTADNSVGVRFHNDRALTDEEIGMLVSWIDGGVPEGDPGAASPPREFVDGWQIEPDEVLTIPSFEIPATGTVDYTYYILPYEFTEDRWIRITEMRPSNREVTHHLIAYLRPPGSSFFRDYPVGEFFVPELEERSPAGEACSTCEISPVEGESGLRFRQILGGYAPGWNPGEANFPADQAMFIEAGSTVVFEVHYTTNGTPTSDTPKLGIVYLDGEPATRRLGSAVVNGDFEIPPHAANHRVDAAIAIEHDVRLLSLTPHMHLRGKSFEMRAVFPDGRTQVLLSVPRYDFNWQLTYYLEAPMSLPAGTIIEGTAHFDNSSGNPHNPDPSSPVQWGDQSWEEMMIGFFDVEVDPELDPESIFGPVERETDGSR